MKIAQSKIKYKQCFVQNPWILRADQLNGLNVRCLSTEMSRLQLTWVAIRENPLIFLHSSCKL